LQFDRTEGPSEVKLTTATFWRPSGKNLARDRKSKEEDDWGVRPHPDYTLKLEPGERAQLIEHLRQAEVIPPREPVKTEPQEPFTDRQLQMAVDFLKRQVTARQQKNNTD
jgi:carboxyl-terminal processing protease